MGASQVIFLGLYFLICKEKGLDSVIVEVTFSFVNSVLFKKKKKREKRQVLRLHLEILQQAQYFCISDENPKCAESP